MSDGNEELNLEFSPCGSNILLEKEKEIEEEKNETNTGKENE